MRVTPIAPGPLVAHLLARVLGCAAGRQWTRVAFDGAPSTGAAGLADALVEPVRAAGHPVLRVDGYDFLRPASIRLEYGRTNPDSFYERWFDLAALAREVLDPLRPGGTGRVLPRYWNPGTDRSARASYVELAAGAVLLLSGPLLQGAGLDLDLTVHCAQSAAALARRTPAAEQWTLPGYARYQAEVEPQRLADVVLRMDDPARPALVR